MTAPARPSAFELRAAHLAYAYPGQGDAVDDVSATFCAGEMLAIVGPNGCGKSTLLRLLCGQLKPHAGSVLVSAPDSSSAQPRRLDALLPADIARLIALVPQHSSAGFDYTVRQIVLMGRWPTHARRGLATALGFETARDHQIANEAMWTADVHHLAERPVTSLSGGERQRVVIARSLAQETPCILLDEPTSALDLWHQIEILEHLKKLTASGKAVGIVTHDLNLARQYAHRVLVMDAGRIVAHGPPQEVLIPAILEPVYRVKVSVGSPSVLVFSKP